MKVDPITGRIGFAFADGALRWSMADATYSYRTWAQAADFIQLTGFTYDKNGYTYGTAAGGESSGTDKADGFSFFTSRWGQGDYNNGDDKHNNNGTSGGKNALVLECTAQTTNKAGTDEFTLDKMRFLNPEFATRYNANASTDVYLAYYDAVNGELRFHAGTFTGTAKQESGTFKNSYSGKVRGTNTNIVNGAGLRPQPYNYNLSDFQILADSAGSNLGYGGKYLSLGVTSDNVLVAIWFGNNKLNISYTTNPLDGTTGTNQGSWVKVDTPLLTGAGQYCQLIIDSDDNIHVAAYNKAKGDLKYIYIPHKEDDDGKHVPDLNNIKTCTVDSYLMVGSELTLDVAKENGYNIPHIGYFGTTPKQPRYAYIAKPEKFFASTNAIYDGVVSDRYNGIWECSIVPTQSTVTRDTDTNPPPSNCPRRINVGVWKNKTTGIRLESDDDSFTDRQAITDSYATAGEGKCYGNGTNNAVLGYGVVTSSAHDSVETAQKR